MGEIRLQPSKTWNHYGVVITPDSPNNEALEPCVIYEGNPQILTGETNVFKMWYRQSDALNVWDPTTIEYAESADAQTWTKYGTALLTGARRPAQPYVLKDGSTYYLYVNNSIGSQGKVTRYTSSNGITLENGTDVITNQFTAFERASVWKESANDWRMIIGRTANGWKCSYAKSTDGLSWDFQFNGAVVIGDGSRNQFGNPDVHKINGNYYCWYHSTYSPVYTAEICMARTSDPDTNAHWELCYGGFSFEKGYNPVFKHEDYGDIYYLATPCLCEANGKTYIFAAGGTDIEECTIIMAVADMTLQDVVEKTTQDADVTHAMTAGEGGVVTLSS